MEQPCQQECCKVDTLLQIHGWGRELEGNARSQKKSKGNFSLKSQKKRHACFKESTVFESLRKWHFVTYLQEINISFCKGYLKYFYIIKVQFSCICLSPECFQSIWYKSSKEKSAPSLEQFELFDPSQDPIRLLVFPTKLAWVLGKEICF